jgi:hypothetical protein
MHHRPVRRRRQQQPHPAGHIRTDQRGGVPGITGADRPCPVAPRSTLRSRLSRARLAPELPSMCARRPSPVWDLAFFQRQEPRPGTACAHPPRCRAAADHPMSAMPVPYGSDHPTETAEEPPVPAHASRTMCCRGPRSARPLSGEDGVDQHSASDAPSRPPAVSPSRDARHDRSGCRRVLVRADPAEVDRPRPLICPGSMCWAAAGVRLGCAGVRWGALGCAGVRLGCGWGAAGVRLGAESGECLPGRSFDEYAAWHVSRPGSSASAWWRATLSKYPAAVAP